MLDEAIMNSKYIESNFRQTPLPHKMEISPSLIWHMGASREPRVDRINGAEMDQDQKTSKVNNDFQQCQLLLWHCQLHQSDEERQTKKENFSQEKTNQDLNQLSSAPGWWLRWLWKKLCQGRIWWWNESQ